MKFFEKRRDGAHREIRILGICLYRYERLQVEGDCAGNKFINIPPGVRIKCYGQGNVVDFDPTVKKFNANIEIGAPDFPVRNCRISVGGKTDCAGCRMIVLEHGSRIIIGRDCMISWGVEFWASDTHVIRDGFGKVVNRGLKIEIGDHVWIGRGASILKNSVVPSGSVVGLGAVFSGRGMEENCVYAGNPSTIRKRNISWERSRPDEAI